MIIKKCPDQLKLPFTLWTRAAFVDYLREEFGVEVIVWTIRRYIKSWGFTPNKPVYKAYEQKIRRYKMVEQGLPRVC